MASAGKIIFHGMVVAFLLTGIYDVLLNYEENQCEMSYMFEPPKYKKVPLSENVTTDYPRYGLYLYGEGEYFRRVSDLKLKGIPVLFIPGNKGSMKQCRSVASFLLKKAEKRRWNPHFNVFTVNLNEEHVAFYGGTLQDQVEFVHHSIKAILNLYEDSGAVNKPQSVVLVGHSMGGMVARALFTLPDFDPKTVEVIYTLATPHVQPVLSIDTHIANLYDSVNSYWNEHCDELKDVSIVSVSGGDRDFQVHGASTRLPRCLNNSIATATTAIPRAWVSADHPCAVWCKQVVLAITRSLFHMVDSKTSQLSNDVALRTKVLRYHFTHNSGIATFPHIEERPKVKLIESYSIEHLMTSAWSSADRKSGEAASYIFFDLNQLQNVGKTLAVARSRTLSEKWVLACDKKDCNRSVDLAARGYLTPKFKVVKLCVSSLIQEGLTQLILKVPKQESDSGQIGVNFLSSSELGQNYTVPNIFSNLWTLNKGYDTDETLGTGKGKFYHRITLSGLYSIFHAYKITLSPVTKSGAKPKGLLYEVEFPNHPGYTYSTENDVTVKLRGTAGSEVPVLHIYTDGETEYNVNVKVQFVQLLGQIIRHCGAVIPTMIALNAMLAFSYQLKMLLAGKTCFTTQEAHGISAKPYKLQPFINLAKKLYTYEWFFVAWHFVELPVPDAVRLDDEFNVWFALLPLVMFLYGAEMYSFLLFIEMKLVHFTGIIFGKILKPKSVEDLKPSFLSSTAHTIILAVLVSQTAGLALIYITLLNFADLSALSTIMPKNTEKKCETKENVKSNSDESHKSNGMKEKMTKDEVTSEENATEHEIQEQDPVATKFYLKLSMQMLWLCMAILAFPAVVSWAMGMSRPTTADPNLAAAIFGSLIFTLHRQQDAFLQPSTPRRLICRFLYPVTIITSMVCLYSLQRLSYYILSFLSIYVAMQYFG